MRERIAAIRAAFTPDAVQLAYQICVQGRADLALAPDEPTGFTMTLLRLLAFEPAAEPRARRTPRRRVGATHAARAAARRRRRPPHRHAPRADWPRPLRDARSGGAPPADRRLAGVRRRLKLSGIALQLAAQTELEIDRRQRIRARVPEAARHLTDKAYADKLKAALDQALGRARAAALRGRGEADATLAAQEKRERAEAQAKTEAAFRDDPFVQDVLSRFDARIKPDSIKPSLTNVQGPTMMKNQLAGLMKQAQAMQDNMKKAQEEIAAMEVEGQSGAGLVKVVMTGRHDVQARDDRSDRSWARTRTCSRTWSLPRQRCRAQGRSRVAGEDGAVSCRQAAVAAGLQAAVLSSEPDRSSRWQPRRVDAGTALPARRRTEGGAAHGAAPAAARSRRRAAPVAGAGSGDRAAIRHCERCNTFTEGELCALCRSPKRDAALLCVVETPADLMMIEQTQAYSGLYFVLMGRLSPLDGIGPKEIRLDRLLKRAQDGVVREVVLATNFTNEGEATAHYIGEMLAARGLCR